jgi:hypothetical protein
MNARIFVVIGSLGLCAPAVATPNFPPAIQQQLQLGSAPGCELCHRGATQAGTVTMPFGAAMRARGLVMYDENALRIALEAVESQQVDSDSDGLPDIEELKTGLNPNVPRPRPATDGGTTAGDTGEEILQPIDFGEPTYGCASSRGSPSALPRAEAARPPWR